MKGLPAPLPISIPRARARGVSRALIAYLAAGCGGVGVTSVTDTGGSGLDATVDSAASYLLEASSSSPSSFLDDGDSGVSPVWWDAAACAPIGSSPVILASGLLSPSSGLQVDANNVYWVDSAVRAAAIDGGGVTTLSSSVQTTAWGNASIAIDDTNVYWSNALTVVSVPKDGGSALDLTDGSLGGQGGYASGLVVRGASAVWAWGSGALKGPYSGAVIETPLDAGASVALTETFGPHLYEMTADDAGIYFGGNGLWALPPDGGDAASSIPIAAIPTDVEGISLDAQRVFWTSYYSEGAVASAPRDGGPSVTLVTGGWIPGSIVIDGAQMYWTVAAGNSPAPGGIMRANIDGSDPVILACDTSTPAGLAVDATSVYWIDTGGVLYKLTPK